MTLSRSWVTGFGLVGLSSVLVLAACSSDEGDGSTPGAGAPGNTAGTTATGGSTTSAGSPGTSGAPTTSGAGGTGTGTAGASPTAGTTATGGTSTGSGGGSAGMDGFACAKTAATCGSIVDFPATTAQAWGKGMFGGGYSVFGAGVSRDAADTTSFRVKGTVAGYGHGFNIWFNTCSSLEGTEGISFKIGGTTRAEGTITFEPQTNSNYPWTISPADKKGACTSPTPDEPWNDCVPGNKAGIPIPAEPTEVIVRWEDVTMGKPVVFDPATSPTELVGLQWQFPWAGAADTEYAVDITIDDVKFIGAAASEACPATGASGGAGGAGSGGGAGAPAAGAPGAGGAAAGSGGASGGVGGSTGGASGGSAGSGGASGGVAGGVAGGG